MQNGRQIARTRVSERVRRIIADARAARAERRRIVAQRIANRESFMVSFSCLSINILLGKKTNYPLSRSMDIVCFFYCEGSCQ